ncbi:MAG: hypothetical protein OXT74_01475, partial [Candidatus Poribacteria bacterium]|nr:hypothetical protein [Candidatus Poribacteria bacterium]
MAYSDNFLHADEVVYHLNGVVPNISDSTLRGKYVGFIAVASVTVYELAIRDIFIEFSRKKHRVFGHYIEEEFRRINGRIMLNDIKKRYLTK